MTLTSIDKAMAIAKAYGWKDKYYETDEYADFAAVLDPLFWQSLHTGCKWGEGLHKAVSWYSIANHFHMTNLVAGWDEAEKYLGKVLANSGV